MRRRSTGPSFLSNHEKKLRSFEGLAFAFSLVSVVLVLSLAASAAAAVEKASVVFAIALFATLLWDVRHKTHSIFVRFYTTLESTQPVINQPHAIVKHDIFDRNLQSTTRLTAAADG
jgi:hypothetical protein